MSYMITCYEKNAQLFLTTKYDIAYFKKSCYIKENDNNI